MSAVLDASALISFLRDEPGAEDVQILLERENASNYVHALNLCEVYYDFFRAAGEHSAESAIGELLAIGIRERNDLDSEFWREVGRVKARHRRVSLADCCALTLAKRLNMPLVSADRHELEPLGSWELEDNVHQVIARAGPISQIRRSARAPRTKCPLHADDKPWGSRAGSKIQR